VTVEVLGPWSLATSRAFWEGFTPAPLPPQTGSGGGGSGGSGGSGEGSRLRTVFRVEADWRRAEVEVVQDGGIARLALSGDGDLDAAALQACRFLSLDIDGRGWPDVGRRDPVVAAAQAELPGLRPCGYHSPYEAAVWSVLSQRIRIVQAARLRDRLVARLGENGAFPAPQALLDTSSEELDLPGRKPDYLRAVADAALEGRLDGTALRSLDPDEAVRRVQEVKGLGPFAAELVIARGANAPDALPRHEARLDAEIAHLYGPSATLSEVAQAWRPFRTWAAVHLRLLRERRTREIGGS